MLLAIDVGNTHTVFAVWTGSEWAGSWRHVSNPEFTEDQLSIWLRGMLESIGLGLEAIDQAICASVVPAMNEVLTRLADRWLKTPLLFLRDGLSVGLKVDYEPRTAVGADRIANALAGLAKFKPPLIVVDFGTGTTLDAVDGEGTYLGGAILPGVMVASEALFKRAAKLPHVEQIPLVAPEHAIGRTTVTSLQSGIMLGYAGGIDALAKRMSEEMGGNATVVATGGLGGMFMEICETITGYEPNLTLDGLRIASERLATVRSS